MKRWVKRVSWAALAAVMISGGYLGVQRLGVRSPKHVKVVSIGSPKLPEVSSRGPAQRTSERPGSTAGQAPSQPSEDMRSVTSAALIGKLQQQSSLTDAERKRLADVFRLASNIQLGIDAEPSHETKQALQRRLLDQIELRLRLILRDDRRVNLATAELQGLPRIDADG